MFYLNMAKYILTEELLHLRKLLFSKICYFRAGVKYLYTPLCVLMSCGTPEIHCTVKLLISARRQ